LLIQEARAIGKLPFWETSAFQGSSKAQVYFQEAYEVTRSVYITSCNDVWKTCAFFYIAVVMGGPGSENL
jgi:hypothetical protein